MLSTLLSVLACALMASKVIANVEKETKYTNFLGGTYRVAKGSPTWDDLVNITETLKPQLLNEFQKHVVPCNCILIWELVEGTYSVYL